MVAGFGTIAGILAGSSIAASATTSPRYWVAPTGTSGAANTSCSTAAYSTIQSAVTAAEATETASTVPTIELCPGTYTEQVTVTKSMSLARASVPASKGAVVIELPASVGSDQSTGLSTTLCQAKDASASTSAPQSVIEICGAATSGGNTKGKVSVSINDVTVQGNWPNSVCYDSLYGVLIGGGATVSLSDSVVQQIGAYPLNGCQGGVGVQAGYAPTGQVGHAVLTNDTIQNYQKNGVTIDGTGSTAKIDNVTINGYGPTNQIAQNGVQISFGATASVENSIITGNNYTGAGEATAAGVLVVGGGGSVCGLGKISPLVRKASVTGNTLLNNDIGISLFNVNATCTKSVSTPTRNYACHNTIVNYHGYSGVSAAADANVSGLVTTKYGAIGDQAGVSDSGDLDVICDNAISGTGYSPRGYTKALPNPKPPAWTRPIDLFSFAPARDPQVHGNTFDGKAYKPA